MRGPCGHGLVIAHASGRLWWVEHTSTQRVGAPIGVEAASRRLDARALAAEMHCPECGGVLEIEREVAAEPFSAVLRCQCARHAVIDGVICLRAGGGGRPGLGSAVSRLERGDVEGALVEALLPSGRALVRRVAERLRERGAPVPEVLRGAGRGALRRMIRGRDTFARTLPVIRNRLYADYLLHRWANPSFLAAVPVLAMAGSLSGAQEESGRSPRVLDVAGGCGHAAHLILRLAPGCSVILTDHDFSNLFLARRFFGREIVCVCLDGERDLPFAESSIDAVVCSDALHYIEHKRELIGRLRRVARDEALWLVPHLHNALRDNPTPGWPMSPDELGELLGFAERRVLDERAVLARFAEDCTIDLSAQPDRERVGAAAAWSVIGSAGADLWRAHDLSDVWLGDAGGLRLNPICRREQGGREEVYRVAWPNPHFEGECRHATAVLPEEIRVTPGLIGRVEAGEIPPGCRDEVDRLRRRFVLVPLPERYR